MASLIEEYRSEYSSWYDMINRCTNPDLKWYHRYGGRGIKVCDRWLESFENFLSDMGPKQGDKRTIERIDNDGDYTPENCRWATWKEQARNTSRNLYVTLYGETRSLAEWIEVLGMPLRTVHDRIYACSWTPEDALTKPIKQDTVYDYDGMSLTLREWSDRTGIKYNTLKTRVTSDKWSIEKAVTTPVEKVGGDGQKYEYNGQLLSVSELADMADVGKHIIRRRLKKNWPMDKIMNTPVNKNLARY